MPITIASKTDGYCRCNTIFGCRPKTFPAGHFNARQLAALRADSELTVRETREGEIAETDRAIEDMTVAALKELLGKLAIEIPAGAKKADLVALVKQHTAPPPQE